MNKIVDNDKYEMYKLEIELLNSGHFTNCYIIKNKTTSEAMVIDPSFNAEYIQNVLNKIGAKLKLIYLTHCHGDHISGIEELYNKYKQDDVSILIHENDKDGIFDDEKNCKYILTVPNFNNLKKEDIQTVKEADVISLGNIEFEVISSPGHTNGSSMLYEKGENILITGDTIFADCYGRTDLKSGSIDDMKRTLQKSFDRFNNDTVIYPGHGESVILKKAKAKISILLAFVD